MSRLLYQLSYPAPVLLVVLLVVLLRLMLVLMTLLKLPYSW
ncbi:hypothetical protein [Jatrophihabitans sp. GAS493]|nr:hypothetical protein [Jatrophihabitans sp. GAS493]